MWSARKTLVIIVCFLPCRSSVKGVVKDLPSVGPTISEGILPILAVGFEDVQRHSRTVTAAALSTMSISMLADRDRGIIRYLAQSGRTGGTIMALYGRHPASLGWEPKPKSGKTGDARGHAGRANRSGHLCCGCGRPIRAGDPHWAGHGHQNPWHYACAERAGLTWSWAGRPAEPPIPAAEMD